jgi:murein tripeptide amidase MpaA
METGEEEEERNGDQDVEVQLVREESVYSLPPVAKKRLVCWFGWQCMRGGGDTDHNRTASHVRTLYWGLSEHLINCFNPIKKDQGLGTVKCLLIRPNV